jgi:hypothetical protein
MKNENDARDKDDAAANSGYISQKGATRTDQDENPILPDQSGRIVSKRMEPSEPQGKKCQKPWRPKTKLPLMSR